LARFSAGSGIESSIVTKDYDAPFDRRAQRADAEDSQDMSEDALRQALARLGGGAAPKQNFNRPKPVQTHSEPRHDFRHDQRRRRFVQDGQVVVEHHAASRGGAVGARTAGSSPEEHEEIDRLRQSVKREQRRCEDGERQLAEARVAIRGLETRAAHAALHVQELDAQIRQKDEEIAALAGQLRDMAVQHQVVAQKTAPRKAVSDEDAAKRERGMVAARKPRTMFRRGDDGRDAGHDDDILAADENGAAPVKWWLKG